MPRNATTPSTKSIKKSPPNMLDELLRELQQKTLVADGAKKRRITKGHALMKSMVNDALGGDQKMLVAVLKLAEKLDTLQAQKAAQSTPNVSQTSAEQWHGLFTFYARYKELIEAQIEQFKTQDPTYWGFEWASQPSLDHAPWTADLQGEKE